MNWYYVLGGWSFGTAKFKEMAATRYTRQIFVFSAIPYLRERNFDGLDMDWEYPKGSDDKKNYALLLKELKEAFTAEAEETGKPRLLLTAAVPVGPDSIRGGYDVPAVSAYVSTNQISAFTSNLPIRDQSIYYRLGRDTNTRVFVESPRFWVTANPTPIQTRIPVFFCHERPTQRFWVSCVREFRHRHKHRLFWCRERPTLIPTLGFWLSENPTPTQTAIFFSVEIRH